MHPKGVGDFKYYVGINSLAELATQEDRVCVLNILGSESRGVTPTSHEYSGGNIVFGTSPGREYACKNCRKIQKRFLYYKRRVPD